MKIEFQDRIDDYLLNRMSDEERKSFETDMVKDKELKEQLTFTKAVMEAIESRNEKLAAMEEWKDDYVWTGEGVADVAATEYLPTGSGYVHYAAPPMNENQSLPRSSNRRILYWFSGIAAVFIVGFFLIHNLYIGNSSPEYLASPVKNETIFRAASDNSDIEQLLDQHNYKEALNIVQEKCRIVEADSLEIVQNCSLGIIGQEQKEYEILIVKYKQDELKWLKVHALLGLGQKELAQKLLDELRHSDGYYQIKADSLYNHIKR